ncbi:heparinase II/III domain-containing protein [Roseateles sp.]|uniref:heparinase II/III domain-containing protein n=1 Tax=Roseateles sp. TaxID=1971397 RepID=UPI003BACA544
MPIAHPPLPSSAALRHLSCLMIATATLAACGGGSGGSESKPQSTALDAATAATASIAGAASAVEASASVPADGAASAATVKAAAAITASESPVIHAKAPAGTTGAAGNSTAVGVSATNTPTATTTIFTTGVMATATGSGTSTPATAAAPTTPISTKSETTTATSPSNSTNASQQAALTASLATTQVENLLHTSGLLLPARTATESWSGARTIIANSTGWTAWLNQKRAAVDKWFGKTRDRAELLAGYPNDYVDLSTGATLPWSDDSVEPAAGTTDREKAFKAAWVAIQRQVNIDYALDAARLYQVTGDTKLAEQAANQLDFYADNYSKWPLRTAIGNSRMFGQTLEEATTVLQMLQTARALAPYASAARKAKWRDGLFFPIATNLQAYSWGTLNNINLWCAVATAAIGMEHNNASWTDAGLTGPRSVAAVMAQGVTKDGVWYEGSFAYNNYVLLAMARLFDLAAGAGRADVVIKYTSDVERLLLAPVLYRFDDGTLPSPNDSRSAVAPVDKPTHGALYRHVPTSYGMQYAYGIRSWASLSDPPSAPTSEPKLPAPQTIYSPDTGFASLRRGNWQVFIHYGQKTQAHAQAEALGYELADGTTNISRDAGTSNSYGSPQHLEYFSQGLGNNVPLVDGQGADGYTLGEVKAFDPTTGFLDVLQASYRTDASARRSFKLDASGFSETSRITLTKAGATPRRLGVVFNTTCSIQVTDPRAGTASATTAPTGAPGFKYWTGITRQTAQATWAAKLNCGGKAYELTVVGPAGHAVYRANAPSTPLPSTRNTLYLETNGTDATFSTSIRAL